MKTMDPLSVRQRIALLSEILIEYVPTWRILRKSDVVEMVRAARNVPATRERGPSAQEHKLALRLGRAVVKTLTLLPTDSRCLIRSLVLSRILTRRSIPHTLVIGVRNDPDFAAHAWVEHDNLPVLPAGQYTRLTEL